MDLNKLIKDINKGNALDKNLYDYGCALANSYYQQGSYMLAMDLTSYFDLIRQDDSIDCDYANQILDEIQKIILSLLDNDCSEQISKLDDLRNTVVDKIDVLGNYTYFLQIFEHILNRHAATALTRFDHEAFAQDVVYNLSLMNNKQVMNEQIQNVLGELPIRLTNNRFFDLVEQGCKYYTGVRNDLADQFFDSIRQCVRPLSLDQLDDSYESLYALCDELLNTEFDTLSNENINEYLEETEEAGEDLAALIKVYVQLIDIINDLMLLLECEPYVSVKSTDMKKSFKVINEFMTSQEKGSFLTPDEDIVALLRELTDRQDVYQGEHMMLEDAFYNIINMHMDLISGDDLKEIYASLHQCVQIATVAVLGHTKSICKYVTTDMSYINQVIFELEKHFKNVFANVNREQKRSMMALTLSTLPIVFNSIEEIRAFIIQCFDNCRDQVEIAACVDAIKDLLGLSEM